MQRKIDKMSIQRRRFFINEGIILVASIMAIIYSFISRNLQLKFALKMAGITSFIITMIRIIIFITRKK